MGVVDKFNIKIPKRSRVPSGAGMPELAPAQSESAIDKAEQLPDFGPVPEKPQGYSASGKKPPRKTPPTSPSPTGRESRQKSLGTTADIKMMGLSALAGAAAMLVVFLAISTITGGNTPSATQSAANSDVASLRAQLDEANEQLDTEKARVTHLQGELQNAVSNSFREQSYELMGTNADGTGKYRIVHDGETTLVYPLEESATVEEKLTGQSAQRAEELSTPLPEQPVGQKPVQPQQSQPENPGGTVKAEDLTLDNMFDNFVNSWNK